MNGNNGGANQYRQMQIKTASKPQILLMLYEAAIQNLKKAQEALEKKDLATKGVCIGKAHDIVNELTATLNFDVGGAVARDLERLYNFCTEQLVKANIENSAEALKSVQKTLETLLEGWKAAVIQVNKDSAAKPTRTSG